MKKTKKIWKKTNKGVLYVILTSLFLNSCWKYNCPSVEKKLKEHCKTTDSLYRIDISNIVDIRFDNLYVIQGPRFPTEVEEIINFEYPYNCVPDDSKLYLAINDSKIVYKKISSCRGLTFYYNNKKGYVRFNSSSIVQIIKKKNENGEIFEVMPQ